MEVPLLPTPQQRNSVVVVSGCGPIIVPGQSPSRNQQHTFEKPPTASRSTSCEHQPAPASSHHWALCAPTVTPRRRRPCCSEALTVPKVFSLTLNSYFDHRDSPQRSSGTDYWPPFTTERVWGVFSFLEVLEPMSFIAGWGWVFQLRTGRSRGRVAWCKQDKQGEGGGCMDHADTSLLVCGGWVKLQGTQPHH